jgi:uncharacterized protein YbjT (DUF2867 family)
MKVPVIGGTGLIGRPLVRELARLGPDVSVLRSGDPVGRIYHVSKRPAFTELE